MNEFLEDNNVKMDVFTTEVDYKGAVYRVQDEKSIIDRILDDDDFAENYFATASGVELVGVAKGLPIDDSEFRWTNSSIRFLISAYKDRIESFRNSSIRKKTLWNEIKNEFYEKKSLIISSNRIQKKFNNLNQTYRSIKHKLDTNPQSTESIRWEFYELFEEIEKIPYNKTIIVDTFENGLTTNENTNDSTIQDDNDDEIEFDIPLIKIPIKIEKKLDNKMNRPETNSSSSSNFTTFDNHSSLNENEELNIKTKYKINKEILEIEKEKLIELKRLRESVNENNEILRERNKLIVKNNEIMSQFLLYFRGKK